MSMFKCYCSVAAIAVSLAAAPAFADTNVKTKTTQRLATSAAGNIVITKDGEVKVPSGAAVSVDSDDNVDNKGKIVLGGVDGATGIRVETGTTADVTNSGSIAVTEDFNPIDDDSDGIVDGPLARAINRYGIFVAGGGSVSGKIDNSGSIFVEGQNSGGIVVDSDLVGSISSTGSVNVIGDESYGIRTQDVSGDVTIRGTVNVTGVRSTAISTQGDIGGTLRIQGAVTQSLSHKTDSDKTVRLTRSSIRTDTPAVEVAGNVAGGIIIAIAPPDKDKKNDDEDKDGVKDSEEGSGSITSIGNGPALLVGGMQNTTIGTVAESPGAYSLVVEGKVTGDSKFSSTDALGIVIGGRGGNVTLTGGVNNIGSVSARTVDSTATAILINQGAAVTRVRNSGTIIARITSPGEGTAYGIRDLSGSLNSIENTGHITASGSSEDIRQAIALSNNTTGVTINQRLSAANAATKKENEKDGKTDTRVYTSINGDIVTGFGNDLLNVEAGRIRGNTFFNGGDDTLTLAGDADYRGTVNFGSGAGTMTMSANSLFSGFVDAMDETVNITLSGKARYLGGIRNGSNLTVNVNGGVFGASTTGTSTFDKLMVGKDGTLSAYIDTKSGKSSLVVVNDVSFAAGSKISATISSLKDAEGKYVVLRANNTISGLPTLDSTDAFLPFIFDGSVSLANNELVLEIRRKALKDLGLTRSTGQAYDAIFATVQNNSAMSSSFLRIRDAKELQRQAEQMLPDHAGGVFDFATRSSRTAAQHISDPSWMYDVSEVGGWLEPIFWRSGKDAGATAGFDNQAWGITGGIERWSKLGYGGVSYTYLSGRITNDANNGEIDATQHEIGVHWRINSGAFNAFARLSGAAISLSSTRNFSNTADDAKVSASAAGSWKGRLYSGMAGMSYDLEIGDRVTLRPRATIDYYRLDENGYAETGKNDAFNLTVEDRNSDQISATTSLTVAYRMGRKRRESTPLTFELEGGRRHNLGGSLGSTIAEFKDGKNFTITPEALEPSWTGEARVLIGGLDFTWQIAGRVEKKYDDIDYSARATLSAAF